MTCSFWEISKKELEDRKAELRNKDREMEELEERHQVLPQHTLTYILTLTCLQPQLR